MFNILNKKETKHYKSKFNVFGTCNTSVRNNDVELYQPTTLGRMLRNEF